MDCEICKLQGWWHTPQLITTEVGCWPHYLAIVSHLSTYSSIVGFVTQGLVWQTRFSFASCPHVKFCQHGAMERMSRQQENEKRDLLFPICFSFPLQRKWLQFSGFCPVSESSSSHPLKDSSISHSCTLSETGGKVPWGEDPPPRRPFSRFLRNLHQSFDLFKWAQSFKWKTGEFPPWLSG